MSRRPRKRKIKITLEARNPDDARRIAEAIEAAAHAANDERPRGQSDSDDLRAGIEPASSFANEQVETEAARRVGGHLDRRAEHSAAAKSVAGQPPDGRTPDSPEGIAKKRGRFIALIRAMGDAGIKVAAKFWAEVLKELGQP